MYTLIIISTPYEIFLYAILKNSQLNLDNIVQYSGTALYSNHVTRRVLTNKSQGLDPKIQPGLNSGV